MMRAGNDFLRRTDSSQRLSQTGRQENDDPDRLWLIEANAVEDALARWNWHFEPPDSAECYAKLPERPD